MIFSPRIPLALVTIAVTCGAHTYASPGAVPARATAPSPPAMSAGAAKATIDTYCAGCHNERTKAGDLVLKDLQIDRLAPHAEIWEKVVRKLRTGAMPPAGMPKPDAGARESLIAMLESGVDREAAAAPNPGHAVPHRLNRSEYTNAIHDILAVDIENQDLLPPDASGYGFDNVADVLSMSPGLLEQYLLAARKISRVAVGDASLRPATERYAVPYLTLVQEERVSDDLPSGTRGGISVRHQFPLDAEYVIKLKLQRHAQALGNQLRGLNEEAQIEVRLDGARVKLFVLGGPTVKIPSGYEPDPGKLRDVDSNLEVRVPVTAGVHQIGVAFLNRNWVTEGVGPTRLPAASDGYAAVTNTTIGSGRVESGIDSVSIAGPFGGKTSDDSPSRQRIFVCRPANAQAEPSCAKTIVSSVARRAFRRPVTRAEVEELLATYQRGRERGSFTTGIQWTLERILTDPDFLLRVERDPAGVKPGTAYRVDDIALASRLSFFLWSSVPDDELLGLAEAGKLRQPAVLEQQVRRMVQDERAVRMRTNFFGQWLSLRKMAMLRPDPKAFPDFDDNLRRAFLKETELFIESQFSEDRPVIELLTANYTFVNERLARHYGIPYVRGSHFRRVSYPDDRRAGLLGQGAILTTTSYAHRTSPVLRGAWILTNILGVPPPPPPANVPPFPEADGKSQPKSVREKMEQHRKNPVCAACHSQMDPIGFALENFDGVGKWRTMDANAPIDASGQFPGGSITFNGPTGLRQGLVQLRDPFISTLTQKFLTYALGRGVEYYDMPAVRQIIRDASASDLRWSSLVLAVVKSAPFQMRRSDS